MHVSFVACGPRSGTLESFLRSDRDIIVVRIFKNASELAQILIYYPVYCRETVSKAITASGKKKEIF